MAQLEFEPQRHAYYSCGRRVLSVSQVLRLSGHIDKSWFSEESRQRGVYVHQAIEWISSGDLDEEALDPVLRPYVAAYKAWVAASGFQVTEREHRLIDGSLWFAGTMDQVGTIGGRITIVDFKSGQKRPFHRLQLSAYGHLYSVATGIPVRNIDQIGLYLAADGTHDPIPYKNEFKVFDGARVNAQWRFAEDKRAAKELDEEGAANDDRAA